MSPALVFGISIAFSLIAWGIVARHLWPDLRRLPRADALRPLLLLHAFRFVGLSFLVPGVVSLDLPAAWARPAAYGDLTAAVLALLALMALKSRDYRCSGCSPFGAAATSSSPSIRATASGSSSVN